MNRIPVTQHHELTRSSSAEGMPFPQLIQHDTLQSEDRAEGPKKSPGNHHAHGFVHVLQSAQPALGVQFFSVGNQFRVPHSYDRLVAEQWHSRTVRQDKAPSMGPRKASSFLGISAFRQGKILLRRGYQQGGQGSRN